MTKEELAAMIDGREYRSELTRAEKQLAKEAGLVVALGASDDLAELHGAVSGEFYPGKDGSIAVFSSGLAVDADDGVLRYQWCPDDTVSWRVTLSIPFARFKVMEDGEVYCEGAVFALADCPTTPDAKSVLKAILCDNFVDLPDGLRKLATAALRG